MLISARNPTQLSGAASQCGKASVIEGGRLDTMHLSALALSRSSIVGFDPTLVGRSMEMGFAEQLHLPAAEAPLYRWLGGQCLGQEMNGRSDEINGTLPKRVALETVLLERA